MTCICPPRGHMSKVIKNGIVGATISTIVSMGFQRFLMHVDVDVQSALGIWRVSATIAVCYGLIASRLHIYGRGSNTSVKWKNGIVACILVIAISVFYGTLAPTISGNLYIAIVISSMLSMSISDALA